MRLKFIAPVLTTVLLAGCGGSADVAGEGDAREASGEILPGSVSDAMIETDRLQSQPPLLREVPAVEGGEEVEGEGEEGEPQTLEEAFGADADAVEAPVD